MYDCYNKVILLQKQLNEPEKENFKLAISNLSELKQGYKHIYTLINTSVNLLNKSSESNKFLYNRRVLKKLSKVQKTFSSYISEYIELIDELKLNSIKLVK